MTNQERQMLQRCGLFEGMTPAEVEKLLGCLRAEEAAFEKNAVIWHMGDPIPACAVILSGAVRAETVDAHGAHTLMAFHHPGALVGDVLMATPGGTSPVYVLAAEDTRLLFLPFQAVMSGCARCCSCHARLRENLVSEIAQKFWAQRRRMRYLSEHSLRRRIALYLLDHMEEGTGETFSLGVSREDMADELCVNRSALSRELARMKEEGLLDFYRDTFRILDAAALRL